MSSSPVAARSRGGRAPATTRGELSHIALRLFLEHGFDQTTIEDIVAAAGIGRRTFFRYFVSKADLPWGDFEPLLDAMRTLLRDMPTDVPLREALRRAVIEFNRFPHDEILFHRQRMNLLLNVPTLVAHSTLRYASWREVVAEFVAERIDDDRTALMPRSIAWACLGLCISSYEQWLADEESDLLEILDESFRGAGAVFGDLS